MEKIYRLSLIFLLLLLALANVVFFASGGRLLSFLSSNYEVESSDSIIKNLKTQSVSPDSQFFDLSITQSEKFNRLKDFEVNLNDFQLPGDLASSSENEISTEQEFEIGNPNPFSPNF